MLNTPRLSRNEEVTSVAPFAEEFAKRGRPRSFYLLESLKMGHTKPVLLLFLLLLLRVTEPDQRPVDSSEWFVIAGKGWGKLCLGAQQQTVEDVIGKGENRSKYDDVYFIDYPDHGIQISYNNSDQTVHTIYFYNRQRRYERLLSSTER